MSRQVDERVVSMQFDNRDFESRARTTMSTLDLLKQKLVFSNSTKGLENINSAADKVNMSGLQRAVEVVHSRFSALEVMGITALANITNSAVNAGKRMVSALTIDPIKTGFSEYETQINAVQTILANTQSKGKTLQDVNAALDELNTYADKTIYNFTEMTRNIGTFTAAGVGLETSVQAIKGIANLAAVSGSTSQQASTAMYQLSQALASGTVKLMDWNSVVNAGMGGQVFQDSLKETARVHGINIDAMIKKEGSFRETLQKGWLTAEILTETLSKFTGDLTEDQLKSMGYTAKQVEEIMKLGETANDAATKVKTFTQLFDTLKEAAQSGWTQSWEIMIGDFEEAKKLLTTISDAIGGILNDTAEARNKLLSEGLSSGWKQFLSQGVADEEGLKESITAVAKEQGVAFDELIEKYGSFEKSLEAGWLTSDILAQSLSNLTDKTKGLSDKELENLGYTREQITALEELNTKVQDGSVSLEDFTKKMARMSGRENIITGLTNAMKVLSELIKPIGEAFEEVFPPMTGDRLYQLTEEFKKFTEGLTASEGVVDRVKRTFKGLFSFLDTLRKVLTPFVKPLINAVTLAADMILYLAAIVGDALTAINENLDTSGMTSSLTDIATALSDIFSNAMGGVEEFGDIFSKIGKVVSNIIGMILNPVKELFGFISENFSTFDIFAALAGGGIFAVTKKLSGLVDLFGEQGIIATLFGGKKNDDEKRVSLLENFKSVLDSVKETLSAFVAGVRATSLVAIAVAIALLSSALTKISQINVKDSLKSLAVIGTMMTMLTLTMDSMLKSFKTFGSEGIFKGAMALIGIAAAVNMLAGAMEKIGKLSFKEIVKGLIGVGGGLVALTLSLKAVSSAKVSLKTGIVILALAKACDILGDALAKFGSMNWDEIKKGLTAMGIALAELVVSVSVLGKFGGGGSLLGGLSIVAVVLSLGTLADALKSFGEMSWNEIKKGLVAMGISLAELGIVLGTLGKLSGFSSIFASTSIFIAVQSLSDIAEALKNIGSLFWDEIKKGLVGMGLALAEIGAVTGLLGKLAGFSGLLGSASLVIAVQSLFDISDAINSIGSLSWDKIRKGLVGMGLALSEVGTVAGILGKLTGFSGILGSISLVIAVQSLSNISDALMSIGALSWDEVKRGLVGMGLALTEIGVISGLLGMLTGPAGLLGSATLLIAVQSLDELAEAFGKFATFSWDQIARGLTAMGGALTELALGGLANTFSILGSFSISTIAEPLGVLAESIKKWVGVTVPDNLGMDLLTLANGISAFTFGGLGALALSEAAPAVGIMADSVKKWADVTVPEGLVDKLSSLAPALEAFTLSGLGSGALSLAAPAVGEMADSVKKWHDVTVPENIQDNLTQLANGVGAFSFAFLGGWSISAIVTPLADLADSISKWKDVSVPDNIQSDLTGIANGVNAFSFAFVGGWSISSLIEPLKDLAVSITAWNGVKAPDTIQDDLTAVAEGAKAFKWMFGAESSLATISAALIDMAKALISWADITVSDTIGEDLTAVATGIKSFNDTSDISVVTGNIQILSQSIKEFSGIDFASIGSGITTLLDTISNMESVSASLSTIGTNIVNSIVTGINSGKEQIGVAMNVLAENIVSALSNAVGGSVNRINRSAALIMTLLATGLKSETYAMKTSLSNILDEVCSHIDGEGDKFRTAAISLMKQMAEGINAGAINTNVAIINSINTILSTINLKYGSFYSAGQYLVQGFADGITAETWRAEAAAAAMAAAAYDAAAEELDINSPSKVFRKMAGSVPEGFADGIIKFGGVVKQAATGMAQNAVNSAKSVIGKIGDVVTHSDDIHPTISPIVDMSNVKSIAGDLKLDANISTLLGKPVDSLSQIMANAQSDIMASNMEVVNAITGLREDLNLLYSTDQEVALYVDSKKLATSLAKPMNRQLNILSKRGAY